VLRTLESAQENPDVAVDVHALLRRAPALGRAYAKLVLEHGPMSDEQAAQLLTVGATELTRAADELAGALAELG
jgi:hypothetical protein